MTQNDELDAAAIRAWIAEMNLDRTEWALPLNVVVPKLGRAPLGIIRCALDELERVKGLLAEACDERDRLRAERLSEPSSAEVEAAAMQLGGYDYETWGGASPLPQDWYRKRAKAMLKAARAAAVSSIPDPETNER